MNSRIVVAGGGFAGLWAALAAKRELLGRADMEVQLISNDPHLTMRPRLYEADPDTLRVPLAATPDVVDVTLTNARIEDINADDRRRIHWHRAGHRVA